MKPAISLPAILLAALLAGATPLIAIAQDAKSEIKSAAPLREVLTSQIGKKVAVRLNGDQDIEGIVTSVGTETVLLTKVTGKEYYDAVISIGKISAVIYRTR